MLSVDAIGRHEAMSDGGRRSGSGAAAVPMDEPVVTMRSIRLLDLTVNLCSRIAIPEEDLDGLLGAMIAAPAARPAVSVHIYGCDGSIVLSDGVEVLATCARADQILPALKGALVRLLLGCSDDFAAVHAGAVSMGDGCALIVGGSDSGKSTLVAALAADGCRMLADDTVIIGAGTLHARPLRFGICLKESVWGFLGDRYAMLADRLVHHDLDDRPVRYISPREACFHDGSPASRPVRAIVFPTLVTTDTAGCFPLETRSAIERMLHHFCPLGADGSGVSIDSLIDWMREIPAWDLCYTDFRSATAAMQKVLNSGRGRQR